MAEPLTGLDKTEIAMIAVKNSTAESKVQLYEKGRLLHCNIDAGIPYILPKTTVLYDCTSPLSLDQSHSKWRALHARYFMVVIGRSVNGLIETDSFLVPQRILMSPGVSPLRSYYHDFALTKVDRIRRDFAPSVLTSPPMAGTVDDRTH